MVAKGMNSEMPLNKTLLHICVLLLITAIPTESNKGH